MYLSAIQVKDRYQITNQTLYNWRRLNKASAAVAKRGFEVVIKKSKKFYPELPVKKELEDRWKETEFPDFKTWKELHDFIKNMGLKYRVPIPDREGFRIFQSRSSLIGVL